MKLFSSSSWQRRMASLYCGVLMVFAVVAPASAERIKDLAQVGGVRGNALVGYGLVVGLDGSGDRTSQAPFTVQSLKNLLGELGVNVPPNVNPQLKNVAAVAIHAELPPFAKPGQPIDITVSSIGNAVSLRGGSLLMAPLRGADGQIYAIAQGNLIVGGFGAQGKDGSRVSVNAQRRPHSQRCNRGTCPARSAGQWRRHHPEPAQQRLHHGLAHGRRAQQRLWRRCRACGRRRDRGGHRADRSGRTHRPAGAHREPGTDPGSAPAKVVVNSRTGTVVIGQQVRVGPAAISHGSLTVTIQENTNVSQPNALSGGRTVASPQSTITATNDGSRMFKFSGGTTLDEIVHAVNAVGAAPGDLIAILEALKQAGALSAELEVI